MAIEDYFEENVVIKRNIPTTSGMGANVDDWSTHLTIMGLIRPIRGEELEMFKRVGVDVDYRLYCLPIDISEADRIEFEGIVYEIKFIYNPMSMDRWFQIDLKRLF